MKTLKIVSSFFSLPILSSTARAYVLFDDALTGLAHYPTNAEFTDTNGALANFYFISRP